MGDRALSGLLLIAAAAFGAYLFYRHLRSGGGSSVATAGAFASTPPAGSSGSVPVLGGDVKSITPLDRLLGFVRGEGLPAPSLEQTTGGQHATNSLHYQGRAVDVGTRGLSFVRVKQIWDDAVKQGFRVLPELYTGQGAYGPSSGPHLHIEAPYSRFASVAP